MKKIVNWLSKYYLYIILIIVLLMGIQTIFYRIDNNKLKEKNTELEVKIAELEVSNEDLQDLVIERNNEIWRLNMVAEEWKQLFYAEIEFYPDESYPYK